MERKRFMDWLGCIDAVPLGARMRIDLRFLKPGFSTTTRDGVYVDFHSDGQIKHIGRYSNGRPIRTLDIEPERRRGLFTEFVYDEPSGSAPSADEFEVWVADSMSRIQDEATLPVEGERMCSFCGKTQAEVAKLVAGPQVNICDSCVRLCQDIVAE